MSWSEKKIASEIGLPFQLVPGRPVICECKGMNQEGTVFFGMKAEVHLYGDNHAMDLVVSSWNIGLGRIDPKKLGEKPEPSISVGPVMHVHLARDHRGDFEFARAAVGKSSGICFAPSYEWPLLKAFYRAAEAISSGDFVDVQELWLQAMLDNASLMIIGARAERKALPWKESLPEDKVGQPEPRKPIGYQPKEPAGGYPSGKSGKAIVRKRPSIRQQDGYRPKIPGRS